MRACVEEVDVLRWNKSWVELNIGSSPHVIMKNFESTQCFRLLIHNYQIVKFTFISLYVITFKIFPNTGKIYFSSKNTITVSKSKGFVTKYYYEIIFYLQKIICLVWTKILSSLMLIMAQDQNSLSLHLWS